MGNGHLVFALCVDIDPEREAEFNEWYDHEHLPAVVGCPGVISGRRYRADRVGRGENDLARYWAVYEVESEAAMSTPEISVLATEGFGPFANSVSHVRRYWFTPVGPAIKNERVSADASPQPATVRRARDLGPNSAL
jgi:hypothetical protein